MYFIDKNIQHPAKIAQGPENIDQKNNNVTQNHPQIDPVQCIMSQSSLLFRNDDKPPDGKMLVV